MKSWFPFSGSLSRFLLFSWVLQIEVETRSGQSHIIVLAGRCWANSFADPVRMRYLCPHMYLSVCSSAYIYVHIHACTWICTRTPSEGQAAIAPRALEGHGTATGAPKVSPRGSRSLQGSRWGCTCCPSASLKALPPGAQGPQPKGCCISSGPSPHLCLQVAFYLKTTNKTTTPLFYLL